MKHMLMHHHEFNFDTVFDGSATNDAVYHSVASPLVREAASGGYTTCLMYGQTGSGKTYTMTAIYERAATELFECIRAKNNGNTRVSVSFFELAGERCNDLLNGFERARLMSGT